MMRGLEMGNGLMFPVLRRPMVAKTKPVNSPMK